MIPANEQTAAAKYFAMSNTCTLDMSWSKDIHKKYRAAEQTLYSEIGTGLGSEYDMWLRDIQNGNEYCTEQWNAIKSEYVF